LTHTTHVVLKYYKLSVFYLLHNTRTTQKCSPSNEGNIFHSNEYDFSKRENYIIDLFLLFGKLYIHQTKWSNSKPNFSNFKTAFKVYLESVKFLKNRKAQTTVKISGTAWNLPQWLTITARCSSIFHHRFTLENCGALWSWEGLRDRLTRLS